MFKGEDGRTCSGTLRGLFVTLGFAKGPYMRHQSASSKQKSH